MEIEDKRKYNKYKENSGWFKKGNIPWDKGKKIDRNKFPNMGHLKKHSDEMKIKMSKEHKLKGISPPKEFWFKIGNHPKTEFKKGDRIRLGAKLSKEQLENYKEWRKTFVTPKKNTLIEIKIQNLLSLLHIEFFTHKYISEINHSYQCDILIPKQEGINQKTIIECDGCYWHGCPICKLREPKRIKEQINKDRLRTKELIEKGFRVIRLWEHNIKNMELNDFIKILS